MTGVLFLTESFHPVLGGGEQHIRSLSAGLAALGNWQVWETGYMVTAARLLGGAGLGTAMFAAAAGKSTLGIPQKVGKEFANADRGGKLPKKIKQNNAPRRQGH